MSRITYQPKYVNTIAITSYVQNRRNKWKREKVNDLIEAIKLHDISKIPNIEISKYEVLREQTRKIYFDIECIPSNDDLPKQDSEELCSAGFHRNPRSARDELIHQILTDVNKFFRKKCKDQMHDDMKFIITYNKSSANHPGKSYHAYCMNYCMNYKQLRNIICEFVNTDGEKYKDYVDCSVYSKNRLFKMPYYIGLTQVDNKSQIDTNRDNHHFIITKLVVDDSQSSSTEAFTTQASTSSDATHDVNTSTITCASEEEFYKGLVIQAVIGTVKLEIPMLPGEKIYTGKNISFGGITSTYQLIRNIKELRAMVMNRPDVNMGARVNSNNLLETISMLFEHKNKFNEIVQEKIAVMHDYLEENNEYDNNVLVSYDSIIKNIKNRNKSIFSEIGL